MLSASEQGLAHVLLAAGQAHLFDHWPSPGQLDADKHRFFSQLAELHASYPGGLVGYVERARILLDAAARNLNPFDGAVPSVPVGDILPTDSAVFADREAVGMAHAHELGFVLVAGGLGERYGLVVGRLW